MKGLRKRCMTLCRSAANAPVSEMTLISHAYLPFGSRAYAAFFSLAALHLYSGHLFSIRHRV